MDKAEVLAEFIIGFLIGSESNRITIDATPGRVVVTVDGMSRIVCEKEYEAAVIEIKKSANELASLHDQIH
ncbi:hypothetical protein [Shewanella algae]|uniref:hypothetical protein n=1 Tax=Shewanella algae TaxID=38313 RepID=UPI0031F56D46